MRLQKLIPLFYLCLISYFASGQVSSPSLNPGLQPYQSYSGGSVDKLNLSNGLLNITIPLISYPQRGHHLKLDFSLIFNSKQLIYGKFCTPAEFDNPSTCSDGWMPNNNYSIVTDFNYPTSGWYIADMQNVTTTDYISKISLPGGTTLDYDWLAVQTADGAIHSSGQVAGSSGEFTLDGSGYFTGGNPDPIDYPCTANCFLMNSGGILYYPQGQNITPGSQSVAREDLDGNEILTTQTGTGISTLSSDQIYADTEGRTIPNIPAPSSSVSSTGCISSLSSPSYEVSIWQVPGANGSTLTYKFCYATMALSAQGVWQNPGGPVQLSLLLLQSVLLPNGLSWSFNYESVYGSLTSMTLPTGGTISYAYAEGYDGTEWIASRTVNANDGQGNHEWIYSYGGSGSPSTCGRTTTTVTDPNSNQTVHSFQYNGYECLAQYYSGSSGGTLLRSESKTYQMFEGVTNFYPLTYLSVFPASSTVTLDNGSSAYTQYQYCCALGESTGPQDSSISGASYGLISDLQQYNYAASGTGSLLSDKRTTYYFQSNPTYASLNLLSLKQSEGVYASTSQSATAVASTTYKYDESTYVGQSSGIGSSQQHVAKPLSVAGDLTTTDHWLNGGSDSISHTHWYDTGEVYQTIDPRGNNSATYAYQSSVYAGGVPVSVTNAAGQPTTYGYDTSGLALKTSETDPNSQTMNYTYDQYARLTKVVSPDVCPSGSTHGETDYSYTDAVPTYFTATEVSCSATDVVRVDLDGLAREHDTKMQSDPGGTVETDTTYDNMGRKWIVSNPYRATNDPTYGNTTYSYDALSRPSTITHPDSSVLTYSYKGAAIQVADEGNGTKNLKTVTQKDALGRVVAVCEVTSSTQQGGNSGDIIPAACNLDLTPSPTTGFLTTYTYDGLGNLLTASQGSLPQRKFTYDSLSRLTGAYNPEYGPTLSGTTSCGTIPSGANTSYCYDANGNATSRTRWAPNQTGTPSVLATAGYTFDKLNRVTDVTYTDTFNTGTGSTAPPTPRVHYDYDAASNAQFAAGGTANPVGRMVDAYTVNTASQYVSGRAFSYDPVGRSAMVAECTIEDCPTANRWYYELQYTYDVTGNPLTLQLWTAAGDASGFRLTYGYNAVSQLTSITSGLVDSKHPANLLSAGLYSPLGGMQSATLGNGATESFYYTNMDRLGCESIVSGSTTLYSASLSNATGQCSGFTGNGYSGNGNVVSSQDSVNGNLTYTYDDFNRLVGAVGVSGPWAGKTFAWTYDRFGNRWSQAITGQTTQSYQFTQGNHHINGYSYDAAGNLLNDGVNGYLYDDENRVATVNMQSGGQLLYSYDAAGQRIRKSNGGTIDEYVYDPSGREIGDMTPLGALNRVEIYAGGRHLVTYDGNSNAAYFVHSDWQGTERVRSLYNGTSFETCKNQPFGDGQTCTSLGADISPMHYTGKPRDTETNLDYFGARYYSSGMARWMSPDWADKPTTVPYANFSDPQSLNLYGYVTNNPVTKQDSDGHMMSLQEEQASWGGSGSAMPYNTHDLGGEIDAIYGDAYLRANNEIAMGQNSQAMFDRTGEVAQQQNNGALAGEASNAAGSQHWDVKNQTKIAAGKDKCNEFVGDMIEGVGRDRPRVKYTDIRGWLFGMTRDPSAKEWATADIPGYSAPMPISSASKGDVIAVGHSGDNMGHVGIYVGGSGVASANWYQGGAITVNGWGFRPSGQNDEGGGTVVVRKWLGQQ